MRETVARDPTKAFASPGPSHGLFAERFAVEPDPGVIADAVYDESRGYAVLEDGRPVVEVAAAGETRTITEVAKEPDDADEPDLQTLTFVESEGADFGLSALETETLTRVSREDPDVALHMDTGTTTKIRAEDPDEPWHSVEYMMSTMTRTGVDYPRDDDAD